MPHASSLLRRNINSHYSSIEGFENESVYFSLLIFSRLSLSFSLRRLLQLIRRNSLRFLFRFLVHRKEFVGLNCHWHLFGMFNCVRRSKCDSIVFYLLNAASDASLSIIKSHVNTFSTVLWSGGSIKFHEACKVRVSLATAERDTQFNFNQIETKRVLLRVLDSTNKCTRIERTHVSCLVIPQPQHMCPWLPPQINYAFSRRTRTSVPMRCVVVIDNNNVMRWGDGRWASDQGTWDFFELVVSPLIIQVIWFVVRLHSGHATHGATTDVESLLNFALLVNATLSNWNSYEGAPPPPPPPTSSMLLAKQFISVCEMTIPYAHRNNIVSINNCADQLANGSLL